MSGLYDQDFHAWALAQAAALRRAAELRINLPDVDIEHLAEEIEDVGQEQARAVESALARIIEHLLKLQYFPAVDPRRGWMESVTAYRDTLESRLEMNLSLASPRRVEAALAKAWISGRRMAEASLRNYDEAAAAAALPADCPYAFDQLCDFDWLPANPHFPTGA